MGGKKGKGGWQENGKERNEWGMECFEWQTSRYDTSSVTLSNLKKKKNKNTDTEIRESDDKGSIERDIRFYFFFFFYFWDRSTSMRNEYSRSTHFSSA